MGNGECFKHKGMPMINCPSCLQVRMKKMAKDDDVRTMRHLLISIYEGNFDAMDELEKWYLKQK
jgi:hypothetical protein